MEDQELSLEEADLLHPLATLHWERCPKWDKIITGDCAVLNGVVCVLPSRYRPFNNMLKVFSITDLLHLQNIPLPREHMALTTYQSKFVTVGGRHPDTRKLTNKLWTSDTGEHWQASLFPMPTERYDTTAVSIGSSPQYLVVAGGNDSEHILNVVEVLVGEQWNTVDPLPRTLSACQLTLHDENLYLVGRFVMCYTICICKCNSLISSCGDAENSSPTSSALWREFEVSTSFVANASYGQRLISIFSDFTIAAYSSMNQSWVEATSEVNDIEGIGFPTSAVVLPTGELLVYCNIDIAYRVKLSVSTFDPDSEFISGVLRLEAVMGIQIVSALVNVYSEVATRSGLQLEGVKLPDPHVEPSKYVNEVISLWSAGHSDRPPTWRELLNVLRDVGLLELSQQIEAYMKVPSPSPLNTHVNLTTPTRWTDGPSLVLVEQLGSESNRPRLFRNIPKTCKGWSIIFAIVLSAAAIIGGVSKLVSGVVFTILGPIRHSDSFITHGDNSLVAGIAFIGAILLAIIFVIYLRRRTKRHVTLAS